MKLLEKLQAELASAQQRNTARWEKIDSMEMELADGSLSVWASDMDIRLLKTQIEILENGGLAPFKEFVRADGEPIQYKRCNTRYGEKFRVERQDGTVEWIAPYVGDEKLAKKGYKWVDVMKPAWAKLGGGHSGVTSVTVVVFPATENWVNKEA